MILLCVWILQVEKLFTEVVKAKAALDDNMGPSELPDLVNDARSIEEYFNALFTKMKDDVWNEESLRTFLDSNSNNMGPYMLVKFQKMAEKVRFAYRLMPCFASF